jgi:L-arabinose isomerase
MIDSRILDGEVWFVTGSQSMYGQETLDQVRGQSRRIAEQLDGCAEIPVRIVWVPTVVTSDTSLR